MARQACTHTHDPRATMCRSCSNKQLVHAWNAPAEQRFWAKVSKTDECWLWTGSKNDGYGKFRPVANQRPVLAHRYAYELLVGPIPRDLTLDHLCRVHSCVNPEHLEPVTRRENILRGKAVQYGA